MTKLPQFCKQIWLSPRLQGQVVGCHCHCQWHDVPGVVMAMAWPNIQAPCRTRAPFNTDWPACARRYNMHLLTLQRWFTARVTTTSNQPDRQGICSAGQLGMTSSQHVTDDRLDDFSVCAIEPDTYVMLWPSEQTRSCLSWH
jgi:hypothetical protein